MGTLVRATVACLMVIGFGFLGHSPAIAHADLVATTPNSGERVAVPPEHIVLEFADPVLVDRSQVRVRDSEGKVRPTQTMASMTGEVLVAVVEPGGAEGEWSVDYKAVSTDGHALTGTISFSVGDSGTAIASVPGAGQFDWLVPGLLLALALGFSFAMRLMPDDRPRSES